MSRLHNLLHLRQVQHLNGGTVMKPIEKSGDYQKLSSEQSNIHLSESDYLDLINDNPKNYFSPHPNYSNVDIDMLAFLGFKINDNELPPSPSPIPWGDQIVSSFTVDKIEYLKTRTGLFMKKKQSSKIDVCTPERYLLAKSFLTIDDINHVELLENLFYKKYKKQNFDVPQAGLTRGSKRFFSEGKNSRFDEIQNKYKDGVK